MRDFRNQSLSAKDYKERFEFKLTVGDFIICQRYFKINNFNPICESSYDLTYAIRECANMIDSELQQKTAIYMEIMAPMIFKDEGEMNKYYQNPYNCGRMRLGNIILLKEGENKTYFWGDENKPVISEATIDSNEFITEITDDDVTEFTLSFLDNGREVVSVTWTGIYPKYIRNSIDLSNKRGKYEGEDPSVLGFEAYLLNKLVAGRTDLVYQIIKKICGVCCNSDDDWYDVEDTYYTKEKSGDTWNQVGRGKKYKNIQKQKRENHSKNI